MICKFNLKLSMKSILKGISMQYLKFKQLKKSNQISQEA